MAAFGWHRVLCAPWCSETDLNAAVHAVQLGYAVPLQWWLVFLPQFVGHAGHFVLVLFVLTAAVSSHAGQPLTHSGLQLPAGLDLMCTSYLTA
jgi:hypothetical protein